jgi:hypothetical protein
MILSRAPMDARCSSVTTRKSVTTLEQLRAALTVKHWGRADMQDQQEGNVGGDDQPVDDQQFDFENCKSLQVTNLHPRVTEEQLMELFSKGSKYVVADVQFIRDERGANTGNAFVDFHSHLLAEVALSDNYGTHLLKQVPLPSLVNPLPLLPWRFAPISIDRS